LNYFSCSTRSLLSFFPESAHMELERVKKSSRPNRISIGYALIAALLLSIGAGHSAERWMVATTTVDWQNYASSHGMSQSNYRIMKRYNVCRDDQDCLPTKWVGFLGLSMLGDVQGNAAAVHEARKFVAVASVKTGFMLATPVFGALSFLAAAPSGEQIGLDFNSESKLYLGLAVGSFVCWWIGSFVESAQVKRVAEAFNRERKVSLRMDAEARELGLAYRLGF
jgi:hypothetical protein